MDDHDQKLDSLLYHLCRSQDIGEIQPYSVQGLGNICKIEFDTVIMSEFLAALAADYIYTW